MFSHAAMSAAVRKASSAAMGLPDLDVGVPSRPEPLIVDDELSDEEPLPDLSVSAGAFVREVLPPAVAPSPEQEAFRRDLLGVVRSAFGACASSGTARTYETVLKSIAPKVTAKLGSSVLPMQSEAQFYAFFGAALMLGPKTSSPATSQPGSGGAT